MIIHGGTCQNGHSSCVKGIAQEVQGVTAAEPHFTRQQDKKTIRLRPQNRSNGTVTPKRLGAYTRHVQDHETLTKSAGGAKGRIRLLSTH